jgi:hypothetical protein
VRRRWPNILTNLAIVILVTALALNVGSYLILLYVHHINIFAKNEPTRIKDEFFKDIKHATFPHPYLGLISFGNQVYSNELSNERLFDGIHKSPSADDVKILILGGSVAVGLSEDDIFATKLNRYFGTDRFSVYTAAFPGYKQPQQYLKLIYLDLLGFRPDIVLNYDGFNEIALPIVENKPLQIPAIFPRSHAAGLVSTVNHSCVDVSNRFLKLESSIPFVALVTYTVAKRCHKSINVPLKHNNEKLWWLDLFDTSGTEEDYARRSATIWRESSNKIYLFTKMHNVDYIHVIQPNQHFQNSKIWSDEERKVNDRPIYADVIKKYYKLLSRDGLMAEHFLDQRYLFKDNSETLYIDFCCHLNHRGNQLVIDDILANFNDVFRKRLDNVSASAQE